MPGTTPDGRHPTRDRRGVVRSVVLRLAYRMMIARTGVLVAATLLTGLMAGLFFAYSCSVLPGLAATDDRSFVQTMQWINRRILNGWFLTAFLGSMVLIVAAVAL